MWPMTDFLERTVIIVEDDPHIADLLDMYLRDAGFRTLQASSGERGLDLCQQHSPVLVMLDVGLPGIDGFETCRQLRIKSQVPVLFLTARDDELDRITGLELGADDYVVKPFSPREIVARVKAILRRGEISNPQPDSARITIGDGLVVDNDRREVTCAGSPVALATKEFDLLSYFANNQGIALNRQQLIDNVWGTDWFGDDRTVDVHIRQLRKKLGPDLPLATVWGIGYRLG